MMEQELRPFDIENRTIRSVEFVRHRSKFSPNFLNNDEQIVVRHRFSSSEEWERGTIDSIRFNSRFFLFKLIFSKLFFKKISSKRPTIPSGTHSIESSTKRIESRSNIENRVSHMFSISFFRIIIIDNI